ncbi:MAG: YgjV family protein [Erysipelotrichaceae bacterium]|nr:YgjV family protein [Erysipelotrichaceae bacterium]
MQENELYILYEIIGYTGTILVVLSMMMTSVIKLRIINICGSVLSMTYAIISNTWPIVVMNGALIIINVIQLIRTYSRKLNFSYTKVNTFDLSYNHFIKIYKNDIEKYFHNINLNNKEEVYLVFIDTELVGILVGTKDHDKFNVIIDYAIPKYRDMSIGKYLYPKLKNHKIKYIIQNNELINHRKYLYKMGFIEKDNIYIKEI